MLISWLMTDSYPSFELTTESKTQMWLKLQMSWSLLLTLGIFGLDWDNSQACSVRLCQIHLNPTLKLFHQVLPQLLGKYRLDHMGQYFSSLFHPNVSSVHLPSSFTILNRLVYGKNYSKVPYLMGTSMFSCRVSLKPSSLTIRFLSRGISLSPLRMWLALSQIAAVEEIWAPRGVWKFGTTDNSGDAHEIY